MYPLDVVSNAARPVTLAGKIYQVRPLTLREWGGLQAWLRASVEGPIKAAARAVAEMEAAGTRVPESVQRTMFAAATEQDRRWPPRVGTMAWLRAIEEADGGPARFVATALAAGGAAVPDEEAEAIARDADLAQLIAVCLFGRDVAPKSAGEAAAPTPTPGNPTTGADSSSTSSPSGTDGPSTTS